MCHLLVLGRAWKLPLGCPMYPSWPKTKGPENNLLQIISDLPRKHELDFCSKKCQCRYNLGHSQTPGEPELSSRHGSGVTIWHPATPLSPQPPPYCLGHAITGKDELPLDPHKPRKCSQTSISNETWRTLTRVAVLAKRLPVKMRGQLELSNFLEGL